MKAMNMDESANGSLSVEFRHLVGLTVFYYCKKQYFFFFTVVSREINSLETLEGELYYCQGHTHFLSLCTERLFLEPLYAILYFIHSLK